MTGTPHSGAEHGGPRGSVTGRGPRTTTCDVPLKTLLRWSEALAAIARTGLGFTESLYEQERFEEILKVAADIRAEADGEATDAEDADGPGAGVDGHRWARASPAT